MAGIITRRKLIAGLAAGGSSVALSAWTGPTYNPFFQGKVLSIGGWLNYHAQRLIVGNALAQEFPESDMSPVFRTNGNTDPDTPEYGKLAANQFADWRLRIDGLVVSPTSYSLAELKASRRAPRSRGTTVSKAGALSAGGRAFSSVSSSSMSDCSRTPVSSCFTARTISTGRPTTKASTWLTPSTPRRCWPTR